jgi:hypothetical protein
LKALTWTNLSGPDIRRDYREALDKIDPEERDKVQNLATSDHIALIVNKEAPHLRLEGLYMAIAAFANAKRVMAVYLDGWNYEELEHGAHLILREPSRRLVGRHLYGKSFWPDNHCSCFSSVVEQWGNFGSEELRYDDIDRIKARLAGLSPTRTPSIESQMVFTPHIWSVFNGVRKRYDSAGLGDKGNSI